MEDTRLRLAQAAMRAILIPNRGKPMMWYNLAYGHVGSPFNEELKQEFGQNIEDGLIEAIHLLGEPEFPTARQIAEKSGKDPDNNQTAAS